MNIKLLQCLQSIQKELKSIGIKSWLDYGQLLGAKRNGKLIPWDKDIDFGVLIDDNNKIKDVCLLVYKTLDLPIDPLALLPNHNIITKYFKDEFNIDFFYWFENDKYYHTPYAPKGGLNMRSFFFDELDEITLEGITFDCPRHLDLFLKVRYGDTWETPIQKEYSFIKTNPGNSYQEKKFHCVTAGVFDLLHDGHIKLFERAKKEFDILTIGIHSDGVVQSYKRKPINNQETRYQQILDLKIADFVLKDFPLVCNEDVIKDYDFVIYGKEENNLKYYPHHIKNHPVDRTKNISTTQLINSQT